MRDAADGKRLMLLLSRVFVGRHAKNGQTSLPSHKTKMHDYLSPVAVGRVAFIDHLSHFFPKNVRGKHIIRGGNVGVRIAIIVRRHIRRLQMSENYRLLSCTGRLIRHCGKKTYAAVCVYSNNAASAAG